MQKMEMIHELGLQKAGKGKFLEKVVFTKMSEELLPMEMILIKEIIF